MYRTIDQKRQLVILDVKIDRKSVLYWMFLGYKSMCGKLMCSGLIGHLMIIIVPIQRHMGAILHPKFVSKWEILPQHLHFHTFSKFPSNYKLSPNFTRSCNRKPLDNSAFFPPLNFLIFLISPKNQLKTLDNSTFLRHIYNNFIRKSHQNH